jgi:hypothetical protein
MVSHSASRHRALALASQRKQREFNPLSNSHMPNTVLAKAKMSPLCICQVLSYGGNISRVWPYFSLNKNTDAQVQGSCGAPPCLSPVETRNTWLQGHQLTVHHNGAMAHACTILWCKARGMICPGQRSCPSNARQWSLSELVRSN